MRILPLLIALLPLAAALSGCAVPGASDETPRDDPTLAPAGQPPTQVSSTDKAPPASEEPPAASSQGPANGTSPPSAPASGGNATQEGGSTSSTPPASQGPRKREETAEGEATLLAKAPCAAPPEVPAPCGVAFEAPSVTLPVAEPGPALATLVVTWSATASTPTGLAFNVTTPEGVSVGSGAGASPLTLTLDPKLLSGAKEVLVTPSAATPGAGGQVTYSLVLALEYR